MDRYLTLAQAGEYAGGHSARWERRHLLPNVPYVDLPGSGAALFKACDIDAFLEQHRKTPVNVDSIVARIMGPVAVRKAR